MYLFLRLFLGTYASAFGAFIFMFSGFNTAWFYWAHVNTAIWTPWVLYATYRYLNTRQNKHLPLISITMLMLNLGGFPMVAVMTYIVLAIMVISSWITHKSTLKSHLSVLLKLVAFSLIAILIALPFIYPLAELLSWMGGMQHRSIGAGFKLYDMNLFINPDFYRYPRVESTFYVGILPLVLFFISLVLLFIKPRFLLFYGLSILLISMSISFTFIDINILREIPLINSSLLTRFGYLIGLALAIISAYAFDFLFLKLKSYKKLSLLFVILIFSVQVIDQKKLFNRFNDAVPSESFYPETKTLKYLQENLQPYQYVMADSGFLISGTLGGYKLNDWFAHSFHTGSEKETLRKIVNKPFKTPTSAMFNFSQINLDSPYIDYLNIKAILSTSSISERIPLWKNSTTAVPCPVLPTHSLLQPFEIHEPTYAESIMLHLATYGEKNSFSDIIVTLSKENKILEKITVAKELIHDNAWVNFKFQSPRTLTKGMYTTSVELKDKQSPKPITVWSNPNEEKHKLIVDGKQVPLSFHMTLSKQKDFGEHYKSHQLEQGISLIENLHVKDGAYFIKKLDSNHSINHTYVDTKHLSNTEIEITYSGKDTGWIIMPMRHYPGWHATLNNKSVTIDKFLGFLPAIKVAGKSNIIMSYSPKYNTYLYLLSLFSIFILLYFQIKFFNKDTSSNL
jgi:hypothetical protein